MEDSDGRPEFLRYRGSEFSGDAEQRRLTAGLCDMLRAEPPKGSRRRVHATLGFFTSADFRPFVDELHFTRLHDFLSSGDRWTSHTPWISGVTYSVPRPGQGLAYVRETEDRLGDGCFEPAATAAWHLYCPSRDKAVRVAAEDLREVSPPPTWSRYEAVEVRSQRDFVYFSASLSSHVAFELKASWEGPTYAEACRARRQFGVRISVAPGSSPGGDAPDPEAVVTSLLEKTMDVLDRQSGLPALFSAPDGAVTPELVALDQEDSSADAEPLPVDCDGVSSCA